MRSIPGATGGSVRLNRLYTRLMETKPRFIGYPVNQELHRYASLFRFLRFSINNYGDPFHYTNYKMNTHKIERIVVSTFASLLGADLESTWGYVTSGTTESHLCSLYAARIGFPKGIVYFSSFSHSSIVKAVDILGMTPVTVESKDNREMDYRSLESLVRADSPAIVVANIGCTMTGGVDSLPQIHAVLDRLRVPGRYVHADAALSGMIFPFVDGAPPFRFPDGLDSIAISGHKMIGSPLPCGIVMVLQPHITRLRASRNLNVEYVSCVDTTITSSRSGFAPLILYQALHELGVLNKYNQIGGAKGMKQKVQDASEIAAYAVDRMRQHQINAWRHQNSLTVVFPRTTRNLERKWSLASGGDISHIVVMPRVQREAIDDLVDDLVQSSQGF